MYKCVPLNNGTAILHPNISIIKNVIQYSNVKEKYQ